MNKSEMLEPILEDVSKRYFVCRDKYEKRIGTIDYDYEQSQDRKAFLVLKAEMHDFHKTVQQKNLIHIRKANNQK